MVPRTRPSAIGIPFQNGEYAMLILILIYTGSVVVASIIGGIISDRSGRRKMMVTVSGLLMAGQRPPVPPAAEPAQSPAARGAVGQRANDRGGQGRGDSPDGGHHPKGDDLVARRDVLQLEREHDLHRRLVRHPHAQAGQRKAGDPAVPHVPGRFGQR